MGKYSFILMLVSSCGHYHNQPIITKKAEHYTSPDKKVDVEILIEKSNRHNPQSYLGRIRLAPDTEIATHQHEISDEYLYFVKGGGVISIDGVSYDVKDGMTFYIPKGMQHSYKNTSEAMAKALQFYTPSGPEQRFKEWK